MKKCFKLSRCIGIVVWAVLFANPSTANTLVCNNNINVSVDLDCQVSLNADMLLEGQLEGNYEIILLMTPLISGTDSVTFDAYNVLNESITVRVEQGANYCWGSITVVDQRPPDCAYNPIIHNLQMSCNLMDPFDIPEPEDLFVDNCYGPVSIQVISQDTLGDLCEDNGLIFQRCYSGIDAAGNVNAQGNCCQFLQVIRPDFPEAPEDVIWTAANYAEYPNIIEATEYISDDLGISGSGAIDQSLLQCGWSFGFSDEIQNEEPGFSLIIKRTWYILDDCDASDLISDIQFIYVTSSQPILSTNNIEEMQVQVYPNPFTKELFIESDFQIQGELYDNKGQKLLRFNRKRVDVSHLERGIYYLRVYSVERNTLVIKKIIK